MGELAGYKVLYYPFYFVPTTPVHHYFSDQIIHLFQGFFSLFGEDQGLVVNLVDALLLHSLQQGCSWINGGLVAQLRIHGAQGCVGVHDYLVSRKGYESSAAHSKMRNYNRLPGRVSLQGHGNLSCR